MQNQDVDVQLDGTGHSSTTTDDTLSGQSRSKKLYHKKSRTGCATCRSRRVKCDEVHPICGNCERYGVNCFYDRVKLAIAGSQGGQNQNRAQNAPTGQLSAYVANRTSRHLLELRLIHHFTTQTVDTLPTSPEPGLAKIWRESCPELATKHPALLDSIFAMAALHITLTQPSSDLFNAHCQYMDSALRGHRNDVSHVNISNVDAVWFTSSLLRTTLFARLQYRDTQPYQLPEEWLSLIGMLRSTFYSIWSVVRSDPEAAKGSVMILFRDASVAQRWWSRKLDVEKAQAFSHLIERVNPRDQLEPWDPEISEAYMYASAALGNLKESVDVMGVIGFIGLLPAKFSHLLLERRPRALVIFAHYFAFMPELSDMWMVGAAPQKEITGIASVVPEEWQPLMQWPLSVRDSLVSAVNDEDDLTKS
ncbi:hypothetical protein EYB26_001063 [Talaromyces marneffei]|uniref:uncharacterized protein n=1 Tax=Talaromyces marneffei TaxID=37727 RepID=UPI0012A9EA2B|nr:uncharacterized protein EYB26_001063 [Talaromyces marneffei]QGA13413.1 hypothetical protein EYB26_001063 [Talaromyces marneffei]